MSNKNEKENDLDVTCPICFYYFIVAGNIPATTRCDRCGFQINLRKISKNN